MDTRATCLNCMDGRVQLPVLSWVQSNYPVKVVDVITEAGMDGVLANQQDISEVLRSINVSVNINKSQYLFVVGHHDCRGNPVDEKTHLDCVKKAVARLQPLYPDKGVVGLWVTPEWQVRRV